MQEFNKIFDSRFDSIFSRLLDKKYRIDLSKYGFNQYSFIDEQVFIMSNVIKKISDLIILIPNVEVDNYTIKLINMINTSNSVTDLYNMMDDYLIDKLIEKYRSKDKIVSYMIDRYIYNGYCYHGFNSSFKESILAKGLNGDDTISTKLRNINNILEKYGIRNAMTYNWSYKDNNSIFTTDNFGAAYYYSLLSPVLLSRFVSNGLYSYKEGYDNLAFYIKNYEGVMNNISKIMSEYNINNEDRNIITSTVKDLLEELFQDKDNLSIALINKKSINRDNPINTDDLNIHDSVTTILKPRYEIDRHENIVIDKDKIEIIKVKNYTNLFNNFS